MGLFFIGLVLGNAREATAKKPILGLRGESELDLIKGRGFQPHHVGYVLFDTEKTEIRLAHNHDKLFIPASTAKVPTTVAALEILGESYQPKTEILISGPLQAGVLKGDLYLRGGGNPFLETKDLMFLAAELKRRGVRRVQGRFFFDQSFFTHYEQINAQQPQTVSYNPGVSPLSVNFNRIGFRFAKNFKTSKAGPHALQHSDDRSLRINWVRLQKVPGRFGIQFARKAGTPHKPTQNRPFEHWTWTANAASAGTRWLPVRFPGPMTAKLFQRLAKEKGITLPEPTEGRVPFAAQLLAVHSGESVREISRKVLKYSNNMAAETLGLTASRIVSGRVVTQKQSADVLSRWFKIVLPETPWKGFDLDNHSGLSSQSFVSPMQMASILHYANLRRYGGESYFEILPELKWLAWENKQRKNKPPVLNIRAKTGTMGYGRALSGYLMAQSGKRYGFAIFTTDRPAREKLDRTMSLLIPTMPRKAQAWLKRARQLERALLRKWTDEN